MKRTVLLVLAISVVMSLGGCGPSTSTEPWAAWAFDDLVVPVSGGSGKVATFAIQGTRSDNTATRRFNIEGSYLGKGTTDIQIRRTERSLAYPYAVTETIVTVPVECYQLEHKVTVLQDTTGAVHPAWAEMTLWIPTVQRSVGPVGEDTCGDSSAWTSFVCRAEYADADGRTAKWSWFQTGEMAAEEGEKQGKWLWYCPIVKESSITTYGMHRALCILARNTGLPTTRPSSRRAPGVLATMARPCGLAPAQRRPLATTDSRAGLWTGVVGMVASLATPRLDASSTISPCQSV
jgi:hypothetical protein